MADGLASLAQVAMYIGCTPSLLPLCRPYECGKHEQGFATHKALLPPCRTRRLLTDASAPRSLLLATDLCSLPAGHCLLKHQLLLSLVSALHAPADSEHRGAASGLAPALPAGGQPHQLERLSRDHSRDRCSSRPLAGDCATGWGIAPAAAGGTCQSLAFHAGVGRLTDLLSMQPAIKAAAWPDTASSTEHLRLRRKHA